MKNSYSQNLHSSHRHCLVHDFTDNNVTQQQMSSDNLITIIHHCSLTWQKRTDSFVRFIGSFDKCKEAQDKLQQNN